MNDWQLLEQYRLEHSNPAFARLVERHVGLVYHFCRRRLRDAHLAEDVTQAVFVLLARKGPRGQAPAGTSLAGWLYRAAQNVCANAQRARTRRAAHENMAAQLRREATDVNDPIHPSEIVLEEAIGNLGTSDRELILMRFYENRDCDEIAQVLGVSPNTTAKRLSRALLRIRRYFRARGTSVSSAAVAQALVAALAEPAPAGLACKAIASATAGGAAPIAVEVIVKGAIQTMMKIKAKLIAATAAAVIVGVGGGLVSMSVLLAQSPGTSAQPPATAPATQPAQASDPKTAMRRFAAAIKRSDADAIRSMVHATGERPVEIVEIVCDYATASAEFKDAVSKNFGADAAEEVSAMIDFSPLDRFAVVIESGIDEADVTIEDDVARISGAPQWGDDVMLLVNEGGSWKFSADRMTEHWSLDQWDERLGQLVMAVGGIREFTRSVNEGRFDNFDELKLAIQAAIRNR